MRAPHKEDFAVEVEHVGTFTFGRRTKKDQFKIRGLYSQLTAGNWKIDEEGNQVYGDMEAMMYCTLEVLTVLNPPGFSLADLDPLKDDPDDDRLSRIFLALRQKEGSFRAQPEKGSAGEGSGAVS